MNTRALSEPRRLRLSRLLRARRLPHQRQGLDGGDDDPQGAGDQASLGRHRSARHDDRRRIRRPRERRQLRQRRHRVLPAGEGRARRQLRLRERAPAAALQVEGVSKRPLEQSRPGRQALLQPQPDRRRHRALPEASEQLVRPAGAGRRRRQLGRRQLRSLRTRLHRRRQSLGLLRPAADLRAPA